MNTGIKHTVTGEIISVWDKLDPDDELSDIIAWDTKIPKYNNLTMIDLIKLDEWDYTEYFHNNDFGYSECCRVNSLGNNCGRTRGGFTFNIGFGDGSYPVYVRKNNDGEIMEIRIIFDE
uniref:Uncharacterized protein n=1 Tax=viral metagenome TaxID=1070528 RepID=A0A6C0JEC0_9ZZZZ